MGAPRSRPGEWARAGGLALAVGAFSITDPIALVTLAAAVVGLAFGARDARTVAAAGVALAVGLAVTGDSPLVWLHRGWPLALAGTFVVLRTLRPRWPLTASALGAVAGAAALAASIFAVWPEGWRELDAQVAAGFGLRADALLGGLEPAMRTRVEEPVRLTFRWAAALFPAWLAIASMAGLALAEFFRRRIGAAGAAGAAGAEALAPLREFRFNDHWVWVWIAGLALVVVPAGAVVHRVGANAALLLGTLYALRGLGIVLAWTGGLSLGAGLLLALLALALAPILWVVLTGMLLLGVSDTWLDLRRRFRRRANL